MVAAVLLMLIVTIVLGAVVAHMTGGASSSIRHGARTASLDAAGAGVQALQQALVSGRNADVAGSRQADGFSIDAAALTAAASATGGTVVPTTSTRYRDVDTAFGGQAGTIQGPMQSDGSRQYWQVVQSLAPTGTSPWLTLYVRGWREISGTMTDAAVVKARLKPGSMADYQLVSDMSIKLDPGVTVNGRVHSNGGIDEWSQPPAQDPGVRLWSTSPVACRSTAGVTPTISSSQGTIRVAAGPACEVREATGDLLNLDGARDSVVRMRSRAGLGDVALYNGTDMSATPARVTINATSVSVSYPGLGASTVATPAGSSRAIVFDRDVEVVGAAPTQARLTIAAWSRAGVARAAPNISILGNVGRATPTNTAPRALGLLAEGDIVIDPSAAAYPRSIQAALMASTGGVRLPWRFRTPVRATSPVGFYPPPRPSLTVLGSIASHSSIALRWSWGASSWIGYAARDYSWDGWLATYPPPYWPASNPWEIVDQTEANADCYGSTGSAAMKGTATCR